MLNVSEILSDPDFIQPLSVTRSTGAFVAGGYQSTPTTLTLGAVVTVAKERDLAQVAEGDRVTGAILLYSSSEVFLTRAGTAGDGPSDVITWRGDQYRLAKVWPYGDYGYWKALGVRTSGK